MAGPAEVGSRPSPELDDVAPRALFGGLADESWIWLHLEGCDRCPFLARYLPSLPGNVLGGRVTDTTGSAALETGFRIYILFKQLYERHAGPMVPSCRILDFGCGWGRVTRFFLRDVEPENLIGIDIDETALEACRETNRWCCFERCDVFPPTGFEAGSFDLVYAYSVFSHLSEEAHLRWLAEFERILKPDGILLLTTLGRDFIERSSEWAVRDDSSFLRAWQRQAAGVFLPTESWLAAYDRGEFCYRVIDEAENPHFGFACVPERYLRRVWARDLIVREFRPGEPGLQPLIVCSKRRQ
jgi:SAM-dependent methyltransferase